MPTHKCKDCSHEVISRTCPFDCEICGSSRLIPLEDASTAARVDEEIFSAAKFRSTIRSYCSQIGWEINDINEHRAILRFNMESGSVQTLYIFRYSSTLEFSCPSFLKFPVDEDLPYWISTFLLKNNSKFTIGFWCIEEINDFNVFSMMHNAEITLIDVVYFARVVARLTEECDRFEHAIQATLDSQN